MARARRPGLRRDVEPARSRCARGSAADVPFSTLVAEAEQTATDGTVKTLFRTHDGHPVEAVLMRYRDGRRSVCVSSQSGLPAHVHVLRHGVDGLRTQPDGLRDRRPGAPLPPPRAREPPRLHGHGRAADERRRRCSTAARRLPDVGITPRRTTISTVGWLPGPHPVRRGGDRAHPARALAPRCRPCPAERADAGQRPLSRSPTCSRSAAPTGSGRIAGSSSST